MPTYLKKPTTFDRAKWLVRVKFVNGTEMTFHLSTRDIREYIKNNTDTFKAVSASIGIVNKYIFPYVMDRFKDKQYKHIKIRGKK